MKLNRRKFLKAVAATAAGTALTRIAGAGAGPAETKVLSVAPSALSSGTSSSSTNTRNHELLSDAHPNFQTEVLGEKGNMLMITAPGSKIKANDLLTVTGDGSVETWISGSGDDWIAVALEDTRSDGLVAISFSPGVYPEGENA